MKIILNSICKSYAGKEVIRDLSFTFEEGKPVVIEGVSGIGKTTLLKILMGLEKPDSGEVLFEEVQQEKVRFAPVFQEIRLIESLDAVSNVKLAAHGVSAERIEEELKYLIPEDELHKKVCDLSGGTRRRVEIVRAVMSPSDVLIMDEPLTGLDDKTEDKVIAYINNNINGRLFIASSHNKRLCAGAHSLVLQ